MDTCKFAEDFKRVTNGAYPQLKFSGATYYKNTAELTVKFLIDAFEYKDFTENTAAVSAVARAVEGLFAGIKTNVTYIKTYADESVVKNKVFEFFNSENPMIFKRLNAKSVAVFVDKDLIRVELKFDPALCKMLGTGTQIDDLKLALERAFMPRADVTLVECENSDEEVESGSYSTVKTGSSLRLVEITPGEKLYSRNKIESVNRMPNYIADVRTPGENIVLCGRASGLSRRKFKNKKYDPDDKKSGPEELPIISFQ